MEQYKVLGHFTVGGYFPNKVISVCMWVCVSMGGSGNEEGQDGWIRRWLVWHHQVGFKENLSQMRCGEKKPNAKCAWFGPDPAG